MGHVLSMAFDLGYVVVVWKKTRLDKVGNFVRLKRLNLSCTVKSTIAPIFQLSYTAQIWCVCLLCTYLLRFSMRLTPLKWISWIFFFKLLEL